MEEALSRGEISPNEAEISPLRHTITRAVGVAEYANAQILVTDHQPGDCYLLCSDGLTTHVDDLEIGREMDICYDPEQCVSHLVKAALRGGGHDNITVISVFA